MLTQQGIVKGIFGASSLGGAGAGGYLMYESYYHPTIEEILKAKGLTVLSLNKGGDENEWKKVVQANGIVTERGFPIVESFKSKCARILPKKIESIEYRDDDLMGASRWCTKEETVENTLKKVLDENKLELISQLPSDNHEWERAAKKAKDDGIENSDHEAYDKESLDEACKNKLGKKTTDDEFWTARKFVFDYCTKPKTEVESQAKAV